MDKLILPLGKTLMLTVPSGTAINHAFSYSSTGIVTNGFVPGGYSLTPVVPGLVLVTVSNTPSGLESQFEIEVVTTLPTGTAFLGAYRPVFSPIVNKPALSVMAGGIPTWNAADQKWHYLVKLQCDSNDKLPLAAPRYGALFLDGTDVEQTPEQLFTATDLGNGYIIIDLGLAPGTSYETLYGQLQLSINPPKFSKPSNRILLPLSGGKVPNAPHPVEVRLATPVKPFSVAVVNLIYVQPNFSYVCKDAAGNALTAPAVAGTAYTPDGPVGTVSFDIFCPVDESNPTGPSAITFGVYDLAGNVVYPVTTYPSTVTWAGIKNLKIVREAAAAGVYKAMISGDFDTNIQTLHCEIKDAAGSSEFTTLPYVSIPLIYPGTAPGAEVQLASALPDGVPLVISFNATTLDPYRDLALDSSTSHIPGSRVYATTKFGHAVKSMLPVTGPCLSFAQTGDQSVPLGTVGTRCKPGLEIAFYDSSLCQSTDGKRYEEGSLGLVTNCPAGGTWWEVELATPQAATALRLNSWVNGGHPRYFNLQGSNDGITYTTLYTSVQQEWWGRKNTAAGQNYVGERDFLFPNTTAYKIYRLNITESNYGVIYLHEVSLFTAEFAPLTAFQHQAYMVQPGNPGDLDDNTRITRNQGLELNFQGSTGGQTKYTLDGTNPLTSPTAQIWTGTLQSVQHSCTIKYTLIPSNPAAGECPIKSCVFDLTGIEANPNVPLPSFAGGTLTAPVSVAAGKFMNSVPAWNSADFTAYVFVTLDGSDPRTSPTRQVGQFGFTLSTPGLTKLRQITNYCGEKGLMANGEFADDNGVPLFSTERVDYYLVQ